MNQSPVDAFSAPILAAIPSHRDYLTAAELLDASKGTSLRLNHIAVLWALDRDRDGAFSRADVSAFFSEVLPQTAQCRDDEFQATVQSLCTLKFKDEMTADEGIAAFKTWVVALLQTSTDKSATPPGGPPGFIHVDAISILHEVLNAFQASGQDLQTFLDGMQRVGEERARQSGPPPHSIIDGLMDLEDEALDDFVPAAVVQQIAEAAARGAARAISLQGRA